MTAAITGEAGVSNKKGKAHLAGITSLICGTLLFLFGALLLSAFVHDSTKTILIPTTSGVLICATITILGGVAAMDRRNYALALAGSMLPPTIFFTTFALASRGMPLLAVPGLIGLLGAALMIMARQEFTPRRTRTVRTV